MATLKTKLQKVLEGQSKAQAKGVKRKGIAGFGKAIVTALEREGESVRETIVKACKQDDATLLLAIQECETLRDERVKECTGERKEKKIASVRVTFARILTILRAYSKGENRDKIMHSTSLPEMYAYASRKGTKRGSVTKPFSEEQFSIWTKGAQRVIGKVPGKDAKDAERGRFDKELARLEAHLVNVLTCLSKVEHQTAVPVKAMLTMARKPKSHVRLAKAA